MEEHGVDTAGAVIDADEHHPPAATHGRCLGGDAHPRHQNLGTVAQAQQFVGSGDTQPVQHGPVAVHQVPADIHGHQVQFRPDVFHQGWRG